MDPRARLEPRRMAVRVLLPVVTLLFSCGTPPSLSRAPEPAEWEMLQASIPSVPLCSWSGSGYARLASTEGDVEGDLEVRVDGATRAWLRVSGRAAFGLVADGMVVALPGDGWVLTHRRRTDELQRFRLEESVASTLTPHPRLVDWVALATGALWEATGEPSHTRVVHSEDGGRTVTYQLDVPEAGGYYRVRLGTVGLERCEWWRDGAKRLEVRYGRWANQDGLRLPAQIQIIASQDDVRVHLQLDAWRRRDDFTSRDFEVY